MLELTKCAQTELEAYFEERGERSTMRVFLGSGCAGAKLSLALDEATEADDTFEHGGFTFVVSKDLLETTGNLSIDFNSMGFEINAEKPMPDEATEGGCRGCSSAGACGA